MTPWGSAMVPFTGVRRPDELVDPMPVERVFTRAERMRSGTGSTVEHWAGRLAAKYAVLRVLGTDASAERLGEVEILPRPTGMCRRDTACLHGHPPAVHLSEPLRRLCPNRRVRVSISHAAGLAVAVALASAALPEDEDGA